MLRIASLAALAASLDAAALAYPLSALVDNNAWNVGVEPETAAVVEPYSQAKVVIRDAGQLTRALGNVEQLNTLNGRVEGAGLAFLLDDPAEALAASVAQAQADAEKAQAQAIADAAANAEAEAAAQPPQTPAATAVQHPAQQQQNGKRGR